MREGEYDERCRAVEVSKERARQRREVTARKGEREVRREAGGKVRTRDSEER